MNNEGANEADNLMFMYMPIVYLSLHYDLYILDFMFVLNVYDSKVCVPPSIQYFQYEVLYYVVGKGYKVTQML